MTLFPLVFRLYFDQNVQTVELKVEGLIDDLSVLIRIDELWFILTQGPFIVHLKINPARANNNKNDKIPWVPHRW